MDEFQTNVLEGIADLRERMARVEANTEGIPARVSKVEINQAKLAGASGILGAFGGFIEPWLRSKLGL